MADSIMNFSARVVEKSRIECRVRDHVVMTDQPAPIGDDSAPTPTEFFLLGLTACTCYYLLVGCQKHGIETAGLVVRAEAEPAKNPSRIGTIRMFLDVPAGVPEEKRDRLLKIAEACYVHNSIMHAPEISVAWDTPPEA